MYVLYIYTRHSIIIAVTPASEFLLFLFLMYGRISPSGKLIGGAWVLATPPGPGWTWWTCRPDGPGSSQEVVTVEEGVANAVCEE